jgi:hypothetical protein
MMVALLHAAPGHDGLPAAKTYCEGDIPHQIRGNLRSFSQVAMQVDAVLIQCSIDTSHVPSSLPVAGLLVLYCLLISCSKVFAEAGDGERYGE